MNSPRILVSTVALFAFASASATSASTAYPAFSDYAGKAYNVSYDQRALTLNGEHAFFLSGAVHPPRGTQDDWDSWFSSAKANGLNMVQVYIFWNFHEEVEGEYNFEGRGDLAEFIRRAAAAGLFVNLRVGPYVCAEWTYGGLPAWLGMKPGVAFRQTNPVWQPAMAKFFGDIVDRMAAAGQFASQGGPIVLVQVENELPSTDKSYVEWCGTMAHAALDKAGVAVPVTMCNGETASSAINTCNGNNCNGFLQKHGQNGRVLVDQPALWTENEGGFQTWGGAPPPGAEPYFWGRPISDQAEAVMGWFARGGSHMNYYMWVGGNNFGRWTGDAITTMYADDAIVCPDGLPHQPKFDITTRLHRALAAAAPAIAAVPAQQSYTVVTGADGGRAWAFVYGNIAFLESKVGGAVLVQGHIFTLAQGSTSLVDLGTGKTLFNSRTEGAAPTARRFVDRLQGSELQWAQWSEPILSSAVPACTYPAFAEFGDASPREMTNFTLALAKDATDPGARSQRSTFALYETSMAAGGQTLSIGTQQAMSLTAFVDGTYAGQAHDLSHSNGAAKTLNISLVGAVNAPKLASRDKVTLTILAEELGYANYGFKTQLKKGITGAVALDGSTSAVGTSGWKMRGGLAGEHLQIFTETGAGNVTWQAAAPSGAAARPATWYRTTFKTPSAVESGARLLFNATGLNRGRIFVNGHDAGRYFMQARNDASQCPQGRKECATQTFYYLPKTWLQPSSGSSNTLTIFESGGIGAVGGDLRLAGLALASTRAADGKAGDDDLGTVISCEF